ncbi:MAG: efflux RND transporter periplasmic adaptor subunit [Pirellulaceae bacterium]|nr:efflux RND transporter periplasmic adaptor subunit [Pirellulaceae bacterium]
MASQVSGMVHVLDVHEGSKIKKGQEVGRIRDIAVRLQMDKAKLSFDLAQKKQANDIDQKLAAKNRAVAENEFTRAMEANLKVSNVYPINEIDRLRLLFDRANLELERTVYQKSVTEMESALAALEYKQSQELLLRHQIISPCNGVVTSVEKRIGEWVDPGSILFTIVQIERLRIEGFVNALDITPQHIGTKAKVRIQNPPIESEAELVFIHPDANPVNLQVRVFLEIDNREGLLRPGLRPTVTIDNVP